MASRLFFTESRSPFPSRQSLFVGTASPPYQLITYCSRKSALSSSPNKSKSYTLHDRADLSCLVAIIVITSHFFTLPRFFGQIINRTAADILRWMKNKERLQNLPRSTKKDARVQNLKLQKSNVGKNTLP